MIEYVFVCCLFVFLQAQKQATVDADAQRERQYKDLATKERHEKKELAARLLEVTQRYRLLI